MAVGHSEFEGVGFFATEDDPYLLVDLDSCVNPQIPTDKLQFDNPDHVSPLAYKVLTMIPGYCERSMSGKGLHIIVRLMGDEQDPLTGERRERISVPDCFGQSKKMIIKDKADNPVVELFFASDNYVALTGKSVYPVVPGTHYAMIPELTTFDISYCKEQIEFMLTDQSPVKNIDQGGRDNYLFLFTLKNSKRV